jgi:molecular chaperone DnaJ
VIDVPLADAALGARTKIETFDGELEIQIEPGVQSGDQHTVKNKGVTHLRGHGRGDLVVTFQVNTPTKLDGKQKELFRKLGELRSGEKISLRKHVAGAYSKRKK